MRYSVPIWALLCSAGAVLAQGGPSATLMPPIPAGSPPSAVVTMPPPPEPMPPALLTGANAIGPTAIGPGPIDGQLVQGPLFALQLTLLDTRIGGSLAGGRLDTTVGFDTLIGYRFRSGRSVQFEYRYFGTPGGETALLTGDPGPTRINRHIEGSVYDFDVRFLQGGFALLQTQWEAGIRGANLSVFADRPSDNYYSLVRNRFRGVGPHADVKLAVTFFETGLEFFGRADAGVLFGSNRGFSQQVDPSTGIRRDYPNSEDGTAWTGRWQLGVGYWFYWRNSRVRLVGGYELDSYYIISGGERRGVGGGSWSLLPYSYEPGTIRIINQGPFARIEMKY